MLKDHIIDTLYLTLLALSCIDSVILLHTSYTSFPHQKAKSDYTAGWQNTMQAWICLLGGLLCFIVLLFFTWSSKFKFLIIFIPIYYIIKQISDALPKAEEIACIVLGKSNDNWSTHNFYALVILSIAFSCLHFSPVIPKIKSLIQPFLAQSTQEWFSILLFCVTLSILIFLIISIAISPLKLVSKICLSIITKMDSCINGPCKKLNNIIPETLASESLAISLIGKSKSYGLFKKTILLFIFPFACSYDIFKVSFQILISFFISILWYTICIFSYINFFFFKIWKSIANTSEKSVVIVAFRISLILGLCLTVIINRYVPFFASPETPSAIIEFIASVIIIPVILEWIMSFRKRGPDFNEK